MPILRPEFICKIAKAQKEKKKNHLASWIKLFFDGTGLYIELIYAAYKTMEIKLLILTI